MANIDYKINQQDNTYKKASDDVSNELKNLLTKNNLNRLPNLNVAITLYGEIIEIDEANQFYTVQVNGESFYAQKAQSCLIIPQVFDTVLLSAIEGKNFYILSVLETSAKKIAALSVDEFNVSVNNLNVEVKQETQIVSKAVKIETERWHHIAQQYKVEAINFEIEALNIKLTSDNHEIYACNQRETIAESYKIVTGTEYLKAFNIEYSAEFLARLAGHTTVVTGQDLLKTDAKLIMAG